MHGYLSRLLPALGSRRSLAARGQFLNTFAGLAFCIAFLLLAMGGYLIEELFENPIQDQSAGLLFAALLIATATTLLYFLLHSSRRLRHHVSVASVPPSGKRTHW
jgi:TRAP-type C4-dicarboxylate transport system permease small subunit